MSSWRKPWKLPPALQAVFGGTSPPAPPPRKAGEPFLTRDDDIERALVEIQGEELDGRRR